MDSRSEVAASSPATSAVAASSPPSSTTSAPEVVADDIILVVPSADPDSPDSYVVCSLVENPALPPPVGDSAADDAPVPSPYQLKTYTTTADTIPSDLLSRFLVESTPRHLCGTVDVVVSTGSGAGHALPFWTDILEPLLHLVEATTSPDAKHHHRVLVTQDAHSVRRFSHARWPAPNTPETPSPQTIIVLSGDGGIVDLLNGTDGHPPACAVPPTLAVLPLGTANALFHSLHKPLYASAPEASPLVLALRTLFHGREAPLPVFRTSFSPGSRLIHGDELGREVAGLTGAIVASYGLHASIVWESDTPEYRQFGSRRFGMVATELLRESHAYRARVDITGTTSGATTTTTQSRSDEHGYVLATLVSNLERTFTISPASKPLDGHLRLVRFGAVSGEKTMEIMMAAYNEGAHVGMRWPKKENESEEDGVGYDEVQEVKVTILEEDARWRKVCIDGTVVEIPTGGWVAIRRGETSPFQVLVDESVLPVGR